MLSILDRHHDLTNNDTTLISAYCENISRYPQAERSSLLRALPLTEQPSYAPLDLLDTLLDSTSVGWPIFELILAHSRLWRHLPEDAKAGRTSTHAELLSKTLQQVKSSYSSLLDLYSDISLEPALINPETQQSLSHERLRSFLKHFRLPIHISGSQRPVVAVALPNGPLLGLAVLAVATYYTAAPVNAAVGVEQFKADVLQSGASVVLVVKDDVERLQLRQPWLAEADIQVFIADLGVEMTMTISDVSGQALRAIQDHPASQADDIAILLFTSGTSGTKVSTVRSSFILSTDPLSAETCAHHSTRNYLGCRFCH
jgi:hypothetical protein